MAVAFVSGNELMRHLVVLFLHYGIPRAGEGVTRSQIYELQTKLFLETDDCMGLMRAETSTVFCLKTCR